MGLNIKQLARNGLNTTFELASDLVSEFQYCKPALTGYDTATGLVPSTVTKVTVDGMLLEFSLREIDGQVVRRGDQRLLVKEQDFPQTKVEADDYFEDAGGGKLEIVSFVRDATSSLWRFHVRKLAL